MPAYQAGQQQLSGTGPVPAQARSRHWPEPGPHHLTDGAAWQARCLIASQMPW
jgi:hypothetical protein